MVDFLTLGFSSVSLMAAALTGGVCAAIGVFVVLRGLAFIGAGTAHAAFAGVALAYLLGGPPDAVRHRLRPGDGLDHRAAGRTRAYEARREHRHLLHRHHALAILFIGLMKTYNAEVYGTCSAASLVTAEELKLTAGLATVVVSLLALFAKEFFFLASTRRWLKRQGYRARRFFFLLLTLRGAHDRRLAQDRRPRSWSSRLLLIPAATAYQMTSSLRRMMAYSVAIGVLVSVAGVLLSFQFDLPTGPAIVLLATACSLSPSALPKRAPKPATS